MRWVRPGAVRVFQHGRGRLFLELARRGDEVTLRSADPATREWAAGVLAGEEAAVRQRVRIVPGGAEAGERALPVATLVLDGALNAEVDAVALLDVAASEMAPGGRVLLLVGLGPLGGGAGPSWTIHDLLGSLQGRLVPRELDIVQGVVCAVAVPGGGDDPGWAPWRDEARLARLAEQGALGALEHHRETEQRLHQVLQAVWGRLEMLERSRALALGRALGDALRHPLSRGWRLPLHLAELISRGPPAHSGGPIVADGAAGELVRLDGTGGDVPAATREALLRRQLADAEQSLDAQRAQLDAALAEARYHAFRRDLDRFRKIAAAAGPMPVWVFSGSGPLAPENFQRPVMLARALRAAGHPVWFGYHRWSRADPVPDYDGGLLLQSPLDFTKRLLPELPLLEWNGPPLLLVSYPHPVMAPHLTDLRAAGWRVVYDCQDDWAAFSAAGMARWYEPAVEVQIARQSAAITCVAAPLGDKLRAMAPGAPVHLVPNGYDPDFLPAGYWHRPADPPRIGYFGQLRNSWFDWDALRQVAEARPGYRFELVGPHAPEYQGLPPNVELLGVRRRVELPEIAGQWRAAMICFTPGALADGVDPIKVYEYLALGLPVVSLCMPQIAEYPATTVAESPQALATGLDAAIDTPVDAAELRRWLGARTWKARAGAILAVGGIE